MRDTNNNDGENILLLVTTPSQMAKYYKED